MLSLSRLRSLMCSHWSLVGLLLVLMLLSSSQPVEANVRLCGQRLTRTLFQLCRNQICGLSSFTPAKRSQVSTQPFLEVHQRTRRSGIATSCCINKCSYSYLKSFCCHE